MAFKTMKNTHTTRLEPISCCENVIACAKIRLYFALATGFSSDLICLSNNGMSSLSC